MEELKLTLTPRFNDTDALGHINNANYATWFENARRPLFRYFVPDLDPKKWNLILARVEIDFLAQCKYEPEVEIITTLEKIGRSSVIVIQEAFQEGVKVARGRSVMVHFDYSTNKTKAIPEPIKEKLKVHLKDPLHQKEV